MNTTVSQDSCKRPPGNHWVFGAGGWNIFHHIGVLKAAEELGVSIDTALGASAGSLIAAFATNGYKADQLTPIFLSMRKARMNPALVLKGINPFVDPITLAIGGYFSIKPFIADLVREYGLKPNNKLRILTCELLRHEPVLFEGTDYDLVVALTASGSPKGAFQPLWHFRDGRFMLLGDGAHYHYNPTQFNCGTAIVSKFRPATELPREWELPSDLYFHMRELYFPLAGNSRYVDETQHVVIENGMPEVAGLNFGLSEATCLKMVENGYNTAMAVLKQAIAEGRVTVVTVPAA